jgi:hypothetical protein
MEGLESKKLFGLFKKDNFIFYYYFILYILSDMGIRLDIINIGD